MSSDATSPANNGVLEEHLIRYVRAHVDLINDAGQFAPGFRYPSISHLLIDRGRLFAPGPRPAHIDKLPDKQCYRNSSETARRHGLVYAEGMAAFQRGDSVYCFAHAWCVTQDGTVIDATWDPDLCTAYLGIAFIDPAVWPADGDGLLEDHQRLLLILRDGLPDGVTADVGRPVTTSVEHS